MPTPIAAAAIRSGLSPSNSGSPALALLADQRGRRHPDVVVEDGELPVRDLRGDLEPVPAQPGRVDRNQEQRQFRLAGDRVGAGPGHGDDGGGLVDPGDVVLLPADQVVVTVPPRGGGDVVRVGAGVRLGDREDHLGAAVGKPRSAIPAAAAGVPCRRRISTPMALDTSRVSNGQPAAADSSATIASSAIPAPPPPNSAGTLMPMNPALPRSAHRPDIGVRGPAVLGVLGGAVGQGDLADGGAQIGVFGGFGKVGHGALRCQK